jgi:hypothetical protein
MHNRSMNRPGIVFGGVALAALLLSGCSAPAAPRSTSASPTATAAEQATAPSFRLPLGCDDLVSAADAESALQAPATATDWPTSSDHASLADVAIQNAGGIVCQWAVDPADFGGQITATDSPAPRLIVSVLPDAADAWNPGWQGDAEATETRTFGSTEAYASCGDIGCRANALVGSNWVNILIYNPGAQVATTSLGTPDETFEHATPAFTSIFDHLASAGEPAPAWIPPTTSSPSPANCETLFPLAIAASVINAPGAVDVLPAAEDTLPASSTIALKQAGALTCSYGGPDATAFSAPITVTALPGGAWVLPKLSSELPASGTQAAFALTGSATNPALIWCSENGNLCEVLFSSDGQAVSVMSQQFSGATPSARELATSAAEHIVALR